MTHSPRPRPARRASLAPLTAAPLTAALLTTALLLSPALAPPASATEVKIFRTADRAGFLAGELDGVSLDQLGRLRLADRIERVSTVEEPYLYAAADYPSEDGGGWVVGTGSAGRVYHVRQDGTSSLLFEVAEPQVLSVLSHGGAVYVGTGPTPGAEATGKVYRYTPPASGSDEATLEVLFDSGETYVWALAMLSDGRLAVGTGTQGKLFALDLKQDLAEQEATLLHDSTDIHIRSLLALPEDGDFGGGLLAGTAGEGLLLHVAANGTTRTLYDAAQPEITALTAGPDASGSGVRAYAAAIASEASGVDLARRAAQQQQQQSQEDPSNGDSQAELVAPTPDGTVGSRPGNFRGGRSEILTIAADGVVESLWTFQEQTVFSLLYLDDRLWLGTGVEGELFSFRGGDMVVEKQSEERQVMALLASEDGPVLATTNGAAVYRASGGRESAGIYTSSVYDAEAVSRFGSFRWYGSQAEKAASFSFRSGLSAFPDATWSDWTAPKNGHEIALDTLPAGRYVQWRAELKNGDVSPRLDAVELSYRQRNAKPRIHELSVLEPGQILVPSTFNPNGQTFEPAHPNRDGIFTTLQPAAREDARLKTLWKLGYRSLSWKTEDPNQDDLEYTLSFQRQADVAPADDWLPMVEKLDDDHLSFDATVLPDGIYRFRLEASDAEANLPGEGQSAERVSEPVVIDHSVPVLVKAERQGSTLQVEVRDAWNPLREVVYSVDAGEWQRAPTADALVDGRREVLQIPIPEGAKLLILRCTDAAHNVITFDLSGEL